MREKKTNCRRSSRFMRQGALLITLRAGQRSATTQKISALQLTPKHTLLLLPLNPDNDKRRVPRD